MGREVRRVPKDWVHPMVPTKRYRDGRMQIVPDHQPMFDKDFESALAEYQTDVAAYKPEDHDGMPYEEYSGAPPDPAYYRPKWTDAERTHLMMYEDTSEGTPLSPAFETPEELARWLVDNNASSFAGQTASYDAWLKVARGGWACSAVIANGVMMSGVEFAATQIPNFKDQP